MKKYTRSFDTVILLCFCLLLITRHPAEAKTSVKQEQQITEESEISVPTGEEKELSAVSKLSDEQENRWVQENRITKKLLLGQIHYERDSAFAKIEHPYTDRNLYLLKEAYDAFIQMYNAALKDGVKLYVLTAARPFYAQQSKWEEKWDLEEYRQYSDVARARQLLRYWSMPGTSRHHWGTEVDLNSMKLAYYQSEKGKQMYDWMLKNASRFGFYQPFTKLDRLRPSGYQEEKWHWSYKPLARIFLKKYLETIRPEEIRGFKGDHTVKQLNVIQEWVCGINRELIE